MTWLTITEKGALDPGDITLARGRLHLSTKVVGQSRDEEKAVFQTDGQRAAVRAIAVISIAGIAQTRGAVGV